MLESMHIVVLALEDACRAMGVTRLAYNRLHKLQSVVRVEGPQSSGCTAGLGRMAAHR